VQERRQQSVPYVLQQLKLGPSVHPSQVVRQEALTGVPQGTPAPIAVAAMPSPMVAQSALIAVANVNLDNLFMWFLPLIKKELAKSPSGETAGGNAAVEL